MIDRLETYLRIKQAAERLGKMPIFKEILLVPMSVLGILHRSMKVMMLMLYDALFCIFNRPEPITHVVAQEPVLLEERIAFIQSQLASGQALSFIHLLNPTTRSHGHGGDFMAVLELTRQQKIQIIHSGIEAPLTVQGIAA